MANNASISNISVDLTELSADTSPQLGGNLDLNSNNITGTGNINTTGTITASGTITGSSFSGDGSSLSGINTDLVSDTTRQLGGNLDLNGNNITGTGNIPAANLTGTLPALDGSNLTGVQAASVDVDESTDSNSTLNVLLSDTTGSGNVQMTPIQDDGGLTFNPGTNILRTGSLNLTSAGGVCVFEGPVANSFETTLQAAAQTADRTITLPDSTGTVRVGYQPGEIIECLSGLCDGRTVVGQSGSYTWPNGTQTVPSTSYVNFPGSVISYTPPTGTNVVKYELVYHTSYYGTANPLYHLRFYYDGTEITVGRYSQYQYYDGANQPYNMVLSLNNGSPSIATGKIGTWNSAKEMKLMIRAYTNNYRPDVNSTHYFDGGGSRQHVYPKLTITAIA